MVQHFCHSHAECGTPQAEDSGHQSKTGQHKWWERESWKQSVPKHPPFPLPGLRAAPQPRGPSHRPHKPQYWSQMAFPASTNTWARCMIPAPAQGWQSLTTQSKSQAHSCYLFKWMLRASPPCCWPCQNLPLLSSLTVS